MTASTTTGCRASWISWIKLGHKPDSCKTKLEYPGRIAWQGSFLEHVTAVKTLNGLVVELDDSLCCVPLPLVCKSLLGFERS